MAISGRSSSTTEMELTANQLKAMVATERVTSIVSILSLLFIVSTYWFSPRFNKPINRLIFFASFGNLGVTVASLISEDGPNAGQISPLCQFQAFMVQFFLGVDAYWACCMAVNVYLVFFHKVTVEHLRALDIRYLLGCYGASFIPAFVYLFVHTAAKGKVYGPAIIWCWVTVEWDPIRIATLYGIVWIAILSAFVIYLMAARIIWQQRDELQGFMNPWNENPFANVITTEVTVTRHNREEHSQAPSDPLHPGQRGDDFDPYTVDIEVGPEAKRSRSQSIPAILNMRSLTRNAAEREENASAMLYARVAFLFFIALLITWVPSSINRIYSLVWPHKINFGLNYVSSLVFPLQGFWNAVVYVVTSQTACRQLWNDIRGQAVRLLHHSNMNSGKESRNTSVELDNRRSRRKSKRLNSASDITSVSSLAKHGKM